MKSFNKKSKEKTNLLSSSYSSSLSSSPILNHVSNSINKSNNKNNSINLTQSKKKRFRRSYNCGPCKSHKIKCDMKTPCGSCIKYDRINQCLKSPPNPPTYEQYLIKQQRKRKYLEKKYNIKYFDKIDDENINNLNKFNNIYFPYQYKSNNNYNNNQFNNQYDSNISETSISTTVSSSSFSNNLSSKNYSYNEEINNNTNQYINSYNPILYNTYPLNSTNNFNNQYYVQNNVQNNIRNIPLNNLNTFHSININHPITTLNSNSIHTNKINSNQIVYSTTTNPQIIVNPISNYNNNVDYNYGNNQNMYLQNNVIQNKLPINYIPINKITYNSQLQSIPFNLNNPQLSINNSKHFPMKDQYWKINN